MGISYGSGYRNVDVLIMTIAVGLESVCLWRDPAGNGFGLSSSIFKEQTGSLCYRTNEKIF